MLGSSKTMIAATLLASAAMIPFAPHASAAEKGVKAGYLRCDVAGGISFMFGSSRDLTCTYETSGTHRVDTYTGQIKKYGIDIGYQKKGVIVWAVVAPTQDVEAGALAGDYGGINADLAAGYGVGANALLGGFKDSIALQPLSVEGIQGVNLAVAIVGLTLNAK